MDMVERVRKIKELKLAVAEIENAVTKIEDEIKAEMEAQNVSEIIADVFKIRWVPYTTTRIDTTALKTELPDIALRYTKTIESRRFSIT